MEKLLVFNSSEFWDKLDERLSKLVMVREPKSKFLRSADVRDLLNISDSTLQSFRINGTIPAFKIGATWFYREDEILAALEAGRTNRKGNADE